MRPRQAVLAMYRRGQGFTLIELLTVISIIAILAAMFFPVLQQAQVSGRRTACLNNLKQLGVAFRLYMDDCGRYPGAGTYVSDNRYFAAWVGRIYRYVRNTRVFQCPNAVQQWNVDVELPPGSGQFRTFKISYSYNEYLQYQGSDLYQFESESKIKSPTSTALIADGYQHALFHDWNDTGCWNDYQGCPSGMNRIRFADGPKMVGGTAHWEIPLLRHGGPNIVFCDLHALSVNKDKFRAINYPGATHISNGVCTTVEYPIIYPDAQRF